MSKTRPKLDKSFYRGDLLSTAKTGFKIVALKIQKNPEKSFFALAKWIDGLFCAPNATSLYRNFLVFISKVSCTHSISNVMWTVKFVMYYMPRKHFFSHADILDEENVKGVWIILEFFLCNKRENKSDWLTLYHFIKFSLSLDGNPFQNIHLNKKYHNMICSGKSKVCYKKYHNMVCSDFS